MTVLESPLKLARIAGLLISFYPNQKTYKLISFYMICCAIVFVSPQAAFFLDNLGNLQEATEVLSVFFPTIMTITQYLLFLLRNQSFKQLLEALSSLELVPNVHTKKAENLINIVLKWFMILFTGSTFMAQVVPLAAKVSEFYKTGEISQSKWAFPYKVSWVILRLFTLFISRFIFRVFFDLESSPVYEVCYITICLSILSLAIVLVTLQVIYMGTCLHICALFKDLKDKITECSLKALINETLTDKEHTLRIKLLVNYHNDILRLVKLMEKVFGEIYFSQIFSTILVLCVQAYLTTEVRIY